EKERFRDLARLYVAMTRAKLQLIISYSGSSSEYFARSADYLLEDEWDSYSDVNTIVDSPVSINHMPRDSNIPHDIVEMNGGQFLYTEYAVGLSAKTIDFLRDKVDGSGLVRAQGSSKMRMKW